MAVNERGVRFLTKDGNSVTLDPHEFIRRFLLHVLPKGFVKIRHYGLVAPSNATTKLPVAKQFLAAERPLPSPVPATLSARKADELMTPPSAPPEGQLKSPPPTDWREHFKRLTGIDLSRCPICGTGQIIRRSLEKTSAVYAPPTISPDTS